jgi:hypothetical protein
MTIQTKLSYLFFKVSVSFGIILFILFSYSCKNKNPEQKLYDSLQSTLKYKSYKTLSENTIPPVVLLFNTTRRPDDPKISEGILRLLLGYSWMTSGKIDYAIAESNIIQDISKDHNLRLLARSLNAICMYEKNWKSIANDETQEAVENMPYNENDSLGTKLKSMTFHLVLGTLSIYKEDYQNARFHFAGFSLVSGIRWPYRIANAMADIKESRPNEGLKEMNIIRKNKSIPDSARITIKEAFAKIDKIKPIDPKIFWTKTTSRAVYTDLNNSNITGINKIIELLNNLSEKLKII